MNFLKYLCGVFFLCMSVCVQAQEANWVRAFDVMWESRWHENGVLQSVFRWPISSDAILTYSINASASKANAERARDAFILITQTIGYTPKEMPEGADSVQVQFEIRDFTPQELEKWACFTQQTSKGATYTKARVVLSERFAYRCVLHELMHVMGFPGHPTGDTVLSYFEGNRRSLKPIDTFILKAWYSDIIKPGMLPLAANRALNNAWIDQNVPEEDKDKARAAEREWFTRLVVLLEAFAYGRGEPPTVLYRSGRLSTEGMKTGLMGVQGILGATYLVGAGVSRDTTKAADLLLKASQSGFAPATNLIAFGLPRGEWAGLQAQALCTWLRESSAPRAGAPVANFEKALASQACASTVENR